MKKINKFLLALGSISSLASMPLIAANCGGTKNENKNPSESNTTSEKQLDKETKDKFKDALTTFVFKLTYKENNKVTLDDKKQDPNWKAFKEDFDKGIEELKTKGDFEEYKKGIIEETEEALSAVYHLSKEKDGNYVLNVPNDEEKKKIKDYKEPEHKQVEELTKKFEADLKKQLEEVDKIFAPVLEALK
ncbi:Hypothetical protein, predicted lipoprotein [Metamycoplasma auris 15026]|uniref:Uncharacterized protein n=1 Tax=Metamycoplasma auris 15026 TaxID=1188233 RepID=N9TRD6_9BACT|nr:variable surface lipoprotein [Metamycoplasma auris]ENY68645.1 Hypothetical protein, predicted lipoprotein [Metamycoplasma auris 15026]